MKRLILFAITAIALFQSCQKDDISETPSAKKRPIQIKGIVTANVEAVCTLHYDNNNQLISVVNKYKSNSSGLSNDSIVLSYEGINKLIKQENYDPGGSKPINTTFYAYKNDTIIETHTSAGFQDYKYVINSKGQITLRPLSNVEQRKYFYDQIGKINKIEYSHPVCNGQCYNEEYTYDNKPGIFNAVTTPSWWLTLNPPCEAFYGFYVYMGNCTEIKTTNFTTSPIVPSFDKFSYTYDQDGYPITIKNEKGINCTITYESAH